MWLPYLALCRARERRGAAVAYRRGRAVGMVIVVWIEYHLDIQYQPICLLVLLSFTERPVP